jgi:hypothetical protein
MGILYSKLRIAMAAIGVMVMLPLSSILADGYPWWLVVTQTPTAGWFRLESSFATNMTTTVVRLYGEAVTNMTNNGRTSTVYFSSISSSNAWSWIQGNSNIVVWSSNSLINISNVLFNLPTNNWNWSTQAVIAVSNMIGSISVGAVTNGISGIWELSEDLASLVTISKPQAWTAGLWMLNEDGSVSPSGATTYDTLWTTNSSGDITPR